MFCSNCGHNLGGVEGKFCPSCGNKAVENDAPIVMQEQTVIMSAKPTSKKQYFVIAGAVIAVLIVAVVILFVNMNRSSIVGTWELVEITGWDESTVASMGHWVEIYFRDGTGINYIDGQPDDFTWSTRGNSLTLTGGGWDYVLNFRVSRSELITYNPDYYPEGVWIFRRID